MERILMPAVLVVVFALLAEAQVFRNSRPFTGLSLSPDGQSVFVVAGGSLFRLDQSLNRQQLVPFPGSLVAFTADSDRSYLCWTNATEGTCEVRNALGNQLISSSRKMRADDNASEIDYFMFRGDISADQLVTTRITSFDGGFIVAQPVSPPTSTQKASAMTMVRFNGTAEVLAFMPVATRRANVLLSGDQQSIPSFQAIMTSKDYIYFIFTYNEGTRNLYSGRPLSYIARVCAEDSLSGARFGGYYVKDGYMTYAAQPLALGDVVSQYAITAAGLVQVDGVDFFIMAYYSDKEEENTVLNVLAKDLLDHQLHGLIKKCFPDRSSKVRFSPLTTDLAAHCRSSVSNNRFYPANGLERIFTCGNASTQFLSHWPITYEPAQFTDLPSPGDSLYNTKTGSFKIVDLLSVTVDNVSLLFASTSNGNLLKFQLTAASGKLTAKLYRKEVIDTSGRSLNRMVATANKATLYIMANQTNSAESAVYKRPIIDCPQFTSCQTCVGLTPGADIKQPICGWCLTSSTCTRVGECKSQATWERNQANCPVLQSLTPLQAPVQAETSITLTLNGAVPVGHYRCGFNSVFGIMRTQAARLESGGSVKFTCPTLKMKSLNGPESVATNVALYYSAVRGGTEVLFLSSQQWQNLTVYDCSYNKRCEVCNAATFSCGWCNYDNVCTPTVSLCPMYNSLSVDWSRSGTVVCPTASLSGQAAPISTKTDVSNSFTIVNPVPQRDPSPRVLYQCGYKSGLQEKKVNASLSPGSNTVVCDVKRLPEAFGGSSGIQNGTVYALWGNYELSPAIVTYYDCGTLGRDCTACLARKSTYPECTYCSDAEQATCQTTVDSCAPDKHYKSVTSCPAATISSVSPVNGPVEGGTLLRIRGDNLGISENDIAKIELNNSGTIFACSNVNDFVLGEGFFCTTEAGEPDKTMSLTVKFKKQQGVSFPRAFTYLQSKVNSFSPTKGPIAGGTIITITGTNLNTANRSLKVTVGALSCTIQTLTSKLVTCRTETVQNSSQFPVVVQIDNYQKKVGDFSFNPNPRLDSTPFSRSEAISKGGTVFLVRGSGFNDANKFVAIFRRDGNNIDNTSCIRLNNTVLSCKVIPGVSSSTASVGLLMDGYHLPSVGNITYVKDPTITKYTPTSIRIDERATVTVQGDDLNAAGLGKSDYVIRIGDKECAVQSVDQSQMFCSIIASGNAGKVPFRITVGLLNVSLDDMTLTESDSLNIIIIVLPISGVIVLVIIITIIVVTRFRQKAAKQSREMKQLLIQMDTIEANVARECKEAFTELQTNLGAFSSTQDAADVDIPFLDFDEYALHMLFPQGQSEQSILKPLDQRLGLQPDDLHRLNEVLYKFEARLLLDRRFLIPFIHTLESQGSKFGMRDRVMVASLLMVGLQDNLYYSTEILKLLLGDLIKKTVLKNPKLLLRRTESVAEKLLTNWLTFCLHDYIRAVAGRPLFMLFRAIKTHLENGPVDAITGEAKNSLSEEKLLREKVNYKELMCLAVWEKGQQYNVRLLDCDTVSQAKEKVLDAMYKTTPVSQRPGFFDYDLGLMSPSGDASVPLRDEDHSSELTVDMKRLNSIGHYNVANGASFKLLERSSQPGGGKVRDYTAMLIARPGLASQMSQEEDGLRRWHLTRQSEAVSDERSRQGKLVSEVYLTRLVTAKNVLQKFVDDLFESIFKSGRSGQVPAAIKYLFDYIDQQAAENGISDAEAIQTWKNNSVPLRFWINVIKNPEFVFDIHKSTTIDACLSIVAQAFMDSCATSELRLTKDSPSTKLLYAREVEEYRPRVRNYYAEIQDMPKIEESEMSSMMGHASKAHPNSGLNKRAAIFELFQYASRFSDEISSSLSETKMTGLVRLLEELQDSCPVANSHSRRV